MRNRLGKWLSENAPDHEKLILLSGDIGFGIFDEFRSLYPEKFINCGVAEQNMIGTAAGLAARGYKPIVYTIIPFLLYRPFDFVRNLIGHQNLHVTLIGVGGGYSYDNLGFTHYAIEDIALAKTLPNFEIYTPFDPVSAEKCFNDTVLISKPAYIRLMKGKEPELKGEYFNGMSCLANVGEDFQIYTHGSIANEVVKATMILEKDHNLKGKVYGVWKYSEAESLIYYQSKRSFFIEEHIYPGLFNKIYDPGRQIMTANRDQITEVGTRENILLNHGLNAKNIAFNISKYFSDSKLI